MKLLLVDDEPGIREGLAALLRRKGHEVATAGDGARAAAALAAGEFDAVVTDWRLPDGPASRFLGRCRCPVVAMSGHPEEVEHPALCAVLPKPVAPSTLVATLAEVVLPTPAPDATAPLPGDVAALVATAERLLGPGTCTIDDGAFVRLSAPLRDDTALSGLAALGGDHRVLARGGAPIVEIRWCRDGRPDPTMPVAGPDGRWPDAAEFAVDFHDTAVSPAAFAACLDRAVAERGRGRTVHFLNVPAALLSWATDQGRTHDMPMKAPVGPRLPAVLADLWS
ncbi:MAG: response regulator [Planctomycetota bacterium]